MKRVLSCFISLCTAFVMTSGSLSAFAEETDSSAGNTPELVQETEQGEDNSQSGQDSEIKENNSDSSENENNSDSSENVNNSDQEKNIASSDNAESTENEEHEETETETEPKRFLNALLKTGNEENTENEESSENEKTKNKLTASSDPLTFTVQPQSQTVNYPDPVTFHVEVSDPDRVASWQWYLTDMAEHDFLLDGETAKTDTLKYLATNKFDSGQRFFCQVTDTDGNVINSDKAVITIANSDDILSLLYVGESVLFPGESIDLSNTHYGTGIISFDENGRDFTLDHVKMKNDWVSSGTILTLATNVFLFGEAIEGEKCTLTLIGDNDFDNYYYDEDSNGSGVPLEFLMIHSDQRPMACVINGPGTLAIHGGTLAIQTYTDLVVNTDITITPKHLYSEGIYGSNVTIGPNAELNLDVYGEAIHADKSLTVCEGSKLNITSLAPHIGGQQSTAKEVIFVKDGNTSIKNAEINIDAGADPEFFEPYGQFIGAFAGIRMEGGLFAENSNFNINMWAKKGDKPYAATFTGMVNDIDAPIEFTNSEVNVTIHSEDIYNANGIYASGKTSVKNSKIFVDLLANERIRGIVTEDDFTVNNSDIEVKVEEQSGAKTFGIIAGESHISLSGRHRIHSVAVNGIGFCADTQEGGHEDREYEEGYQSAHIFLNNKTECLIPDNYLVSLTSLPDPFLDYEYYETYYDPDDTSAPAAEVLIAHNNPEYYFTDGTEHYWKTGSKEGLEAVVKRRNNDSHTFEKFTGIQVDGKAVSESSYTAEEGSVILVLKPEYLSTLKSGKHTLTALFEDGSAKTQFTIGSEKPKITIFINGSSDSSVYNGKEHVIEGFDVSCKSSLFDPNELSLKEGVIPAAFGKDAGTYHMGLSSKSFTYSDTTVDAVIIVKDGTLSISPAQLTVRTGSASKYYDGKPLFNPEAKLSGLVNGETAKVKATGLQTAVGSSTNTYAIHWESAKKSNYSISEKLGTLTVKGKGGSSDSGSKSSSSDNKSSGSGTWYPSSGGQSSPRVVNTADTNHLTLWTSMLCISVLTAVIAAVMMKKSKA